MHLLITFPFGIGNLVNQELKKLGFNTENTFTTGTFLNCDMSGLMTINLRSRLANKIYIKIADGHASSFDDLFSIINKSDYQQFLSNTNISIKVQTKNSNLTSVRSIQSVAHKAVLESIKNFGQEEKYQDELLLIIENNHVSFFLNTSGTALHQRGYRKNTGEAPLKENLAAALILLSGWKFGSLLIDPFCGSGTIPIEAALLAKNIAPGLLRHFRFETFKTFEEKNFFKIKKEAKEKIFNGNYTILGSDIDPQIINIAKQNAKNAGVDTIINFSQNDFLKSFINIKEKSRIITNPPYGKRINSTDLPNIYKKLDESFDNNLTFGGRISSFPFNSKNNFRKTKQLFNGNEKCNFISKKIT